MNKNGTIHANNSFNKGDNRVKITLDIPLNQIYFEVEEVDTFDSKYINFDASDYTNLEKTYIKNIVLNINYIDKSKTLICDRKIGRINLTYFDFKESIKDNIDIENLLDAEGSHTLDIYNVVINNFNKDYYRFFGDDEKGNIANIINIEIDKKYQSRMLYSYILRNLNKIIYHLLGLNVSTVMCLKEFPQNRLQILMKKLYRDTGYLEVDNNEDFVVKNICKNSIHEDDEVVVFNKDFADKIKHLEIDPEVLHNLRKSTH